MNAKQVPEFTWTEFRKAQQERDALLRQRDELLAALKHIAEGGCDRADMVLEYQAIARAAIAKVKGEA